MLSKEIINRFRDYCDLTGWTFGEESSEFTFQFRLGWFLNTLYENQYIINFEKNISSLKLEKTKKEVDIHLLEKKTNRQCAIELKFIKDTRGYDIGLYKICQDIEFLEKLQFTQGYDYTYSISFTSLEEIHSPPKEPKYRANGERLHFYKCFREYKCISGKIYRNAEDFCEFEKPYPIEWFPFSANIWACLVDVKSCG